MSKSRCVLLSLGLAAALSIPAAAESANVTVHNNSSFALHHMFLSPVGEDQWGADQLRDKVVAPGESYLLTEIPCADYDLKLVDEDGDECVLEVPAICGGNEDWNVADEGLLECEGFGE
jgi:hypothetical protein